MANCHTCTPMRRFALPSVSSRTFIFPVARVSLFSEARKVNLKCSKGEATQDSLVSEAVEQQLDVLIRKKENQVLFDRLEEASQRVENLRQQLEMVQKEELEAKQLKEMVKSLESRASDVAESQREISNARRKIEEAERSLREISQGKGGKEEERLESAKAAVISAIGGTIAGLPIYSSAATDAFEVLVPAAAGFISCALFGVTFRYVVRRDVDDVHLKSGAVAAFSITKGLGMLSTGVPLEPTLASFTTHLLDASFYVAESFLIFASAALSLDFCLKSRFLSPFRKDLM